MYCSNCGTYNEPDVHFCEACGAAISVENEPVEILQDDLSQNRENFFRWMEIQYGSKRSYHKRMCKALEFEIDQQLPGNEIGNLFRCKESAALAALAEMITGLQNWPAVNKSIGSGTASAALSRYKIYVHALENGTVGDLDVDLPCEEHGATVRARRSRLQPSEQVNCLNGLVDLIVDDTGANESEKCVALARYMVKNSYFFKKEKVDQRHTVMMQMLEKLDEKIPARFSTAKAPSPYYNSNNEMLTLTKSEAISISKNDKIFYKIGDNYVPVLIDYDGNRNVRALINSESGRVISQGQNSDFKYATISHIWGNAFNPIFFTNLWNIVIVPTYLNPILDKSDEQLDDDVECQSEDLTDFYTKAVNYVNAYFKKLCYQMYGLEEKLADYRSLGFDCSGLVTVNDSVSINMGDVLADHLL